MGTFTKGDVVLFPFPYTDLAQRKMRPCLVLSSEMGDDLLLCQITSQQISRDPYVVALPASVTTHGTLTIDSYIRANMLFTAHKQQIHMKLCRIPDTLYTEVVARIVQMISRK